MSDTVNHPDGICGTKGCPCLLDTLEASLDRHMTEAMNRAGLRVVRFEDLLDQTRAPEDQVVVCTCGRTYPYGLECGSALGEELP